LPKRSLSLRVVCRSKCGCRDEANGKQHDQLETGVRYSERFSERLVNNCSFWYIKLSNEHPVRIWQVTVSSFKMSTDPEHEQSRRTFNDVYETS
jgi:hypothetical protein